MTDAAIIIEAWNTVLYDKFARFRHLLVDGLSNHSNEFLGRGPFAPGASVVDIGCGFGDTAVLLGNMVGADGQVVGVDCGRRFIDDARQLACDEGAENVSFLVADVQTEPLGGSYDNAFGRFGTMFFSMPGAAMRNIRRHLKPGGRLDMIVWRKREDNLWLFEAEQCVKELVPVVDHEDTSEVHCGPGPFSMAGPDMVSSMLQSAGFEGVTFERFDADICIGRDLDEAVDFAMALGPAGEIIRLAGEVGEAKRGECVAALRETLCPYESEDGVWAPSSTWFVGARNAA